MNPLVVTVFNFINHDAHIMAPSLHPIAEFTEYTTSQDTSKANLIVYVFDVHHS